MKDYLCPSCHRIIQEDTLRDTLIKPELNKGYRCPHCCDIVSDVDHISEHEYKGKPIEWQLVHEYKLNYNNKEYLAIVTYHGQFTRAKIYENGVLIKTIETDWLLTEDLTPIIIERNYLPESKHEQRNFEINVTVKDTGADVNIQEIKKE